jgi:hypothetical protein
VKTPLPVAASVAQRPAYGGHAWAFLQYALGFRQLGYEPVFIDRLTAEMATDEEGRPSKTAIEAGIEWFGDVMEFAGLEGSCSLLLDDGATVGLSRQELRERISSAPCLINVMGFLDDPDLLELAEQLVFLDVDPGFPQVWRELGQADLLAGHDRFVSVGGNLGLPGCQIPTCGLDWIAMRPPVVLENWPATPTSSRVFSAIGSWRGPYAPVEFGGRTLGLRVHEFRRFVELPSLTGADFRFALDADPADHRDVELMRHNSWQLIDPGSVAASPVAYGEFIRSSGAEIAIAKNIYVATDSGWFSDRSACFLASGRPVLCQDTGFTNSLPSEEGLVAFSTIDEAVSAVDGILADWSHHSRTARQIAEDLFDARKVLGGLLTELDAA